jgi:hypothetical protein
VKLFTLGDFFQVPQLTWAACQLIRQQNELEAGRIQRAFSKIRSSSIVLSSDDVEVQGFREMCAAAYQNESDTFRALRLAVRHFFWITRYATLHNKDFHEQVLAEIPKLGNDLLRDLCWWEDQSFMISSIPGQCDNCHRNPLQDENGQGFFVNTWSQGESRDQPTLGGKCQDCEKQAGPPE